MGASSSHTFNENDNQDNNEDDALTTMASQRQQMEVWEDKRKPPAIHAGTNDFYDYTTFHLGPTGPLKTLLEPSKEDMQHATLLLEQCFSYVGDQREELLQTFSNELGLEYGHSGLNGFFSIIDSNGPCVNDHVSWEIYMLLSLIDIEKNDQWSRQVALQCDVSNLTESLYNA